MVDGTLVLCITKQTGITNLHIDLRHQTCLQINSRFFATNINVLFHIQKTSGSTLTLHWYNDRFVITRKNEIKHFLLYFVVNLWQRNNSKLFVRQAACSGMFTIIHTKLSPHFIFFLRFFFFIAIGYVYACMHACGIHMEKAAHKL